MVAFYCYRNTMPCGSCNSAAADMAKAAARERLEMIKKRIEALLQMLALLGGKGAKALLQELKQLSNQVKQAAAVLRADNGGSDAAAQPDGASASAGADQAPAPGADGQGAAGASAEGRQAYAEQQLASDTDARLDHAQSHSHEDKDSGVVAAAAASSVPVAIPASALAAPHADAQKMEDERLIQTTSRALESLRSSVEKWVRQELQQEKQKQQAARQRAGAR